MKKGILFTAAVFVLASLFCSMVTTADAAKAKRPKAKAKKVKAISKKKAVRPKKAAKRAPRKAKPQVKKVLKEIGPPPPSTVRSAQPIAKGLQVEGVLGEWLYNGTDWVKIIKKEVTSISPRGEVAKAGTKWAVVFVEIKNSGSVIKKMGGDLHSLILVDDKGSTYSDNMAKRIPDWDNPEEKMDVLPNASVEIAYVFSIPSDSNPAKAVFDPLPSGIKPPFSVKLQ